MKKCLICKEQIPSRNKNGTIRKDQKCCGATCRKRLQRLRAQGHLPRQVLPGQLNLPETGDVTPISDLTPKRQPQNAPGSRPA